MHSSDTIVHSQVEYTKTVYKWLRIINPVRIVKMSSDEDNDIFITQSVFNTPVAEQAADFF